MSGFLTNQQLWGCTEFFDNVSDYVYVYLMRYFSLSGTLISKAAMEKIIAQDGRTIIYYHANYGRLYDNGFVNAINEKDQKLTFCVLGAHHQNGIIEDKKFY